MKLGKYRQGQQIASADEIDALLENWPVPEVNDERRNLEGRSTAFGTPLEALYQKQAEPEEEEPEETFNSISIQEIEQIREEAYKEGFAEGKEAGYTDGFEQGKTEGIQAGFEDGLAQGKEQGLELIKPEAEQKVAQLVTLLDEIATPYQQVNKEVEIELVKLTTELAKAVVATEVTTNAQAILATVKEATDALKNQSRGLHIQLSPEDYALVIDAYGEEQIQKRAWQLTAEPSISRGGCNVLSDTSSVDYTIETRLKQVLDSFLHDSAIESQ